MSLPFVIAMISLAAMPFGAGVVLAHDFPSQQVIVDNRAIAGADFVAKAPPDGYTLILYGSFKEQTSRKGCSTWA